MASFNCLRISSLSDGQNSRVINLLKCSSDDITRHMTDIIIEALAEPMTEAEPRIS